MVRSVGNEYAQCIDLQAQNGTLHSIVNVYLPPAGNLGRRSLTEEFVRSQCTETLATVPMDRPLLVCGDFNARIGRLQQPE